MFRAPLLAKDDRWKPCDKHECFPFSDSFFELKQRRVYLPKWDVRVRKGGGVSLVSLAHYVESPFDPLKGFFQKFAIEDLSNGLLVEVFRRLHQHDRLQIASLVCKRWHQLVLSPAVWTQMIVPNYRLPKSFCERISSSLRRVCFRFPSPGNVVSLLVGNWSHLKELEILSLGGGNGEKDALFRELNAVAPQLEILSIKFYLDKNCSNEYEDFLSPNCLKELRYIALELQNGKAITLQDLLLGKPKLEEASICYLACKESTTTWQVTSPVGHLSSLRYSVRSCGPLDGIAAVKNCIQQLTFLDVEADSVADWEVDAVRSLQNLEHFHLEARVVNLVELFAQDGDRFPATLKRLSLRLPDRRSFDELRNIWESCENLRSLKLPPCSDHTAVIDAVAAYLPHLEFLSLSEECGSVNCLIRQFRNGTFPELHYFQGADFLEASESKVSEIFHLRPNLIVVAFEWPRKIIDDLMRSLAFNRERLRKPGDDLMIKKYEKLDRKIRYSEQIPQIRDELIHIPGYCCVDSHPSISVPLFRNPGAGGDLFSKAESVLKWAGWNRYF